MQLFSERLRLRRDRLGLSQDELAEQTGVSKRSIVDYEAGKTTPTLKQAQKLATGLNCTPAWLLTGETEYPPHAPSGSALSDAAVETTLATLRSQAASMIQQIDLLQKQIHPPAPASSAPRLSDAQAIAAREVAKLAHPPKESDP